MAHLPTSFAGKCDFGFHRFDNRFANYSPTIRSPSSAKPTAAATGSTMFNNSSIENAIMASQQQQQQSQSVSQSQQMAKFPPLKPAPNGTEKSKVAVVYSNEYTAKKSMDELFDFQNMDKRCHRTWRQRNLPGTFFDQSSASSSNSHSRDSLDSPGILGSPRRLPMSPDGVNHLSLKRTLKAKTTDANPMDFVSKTRSLPFSFSPSNIDPNSLNMLGIASPPNATLLPNNRNLTLAGSSPNSTVQLESFTQLQRGLMNQNRLKSNEQNGSKPVNPTSATAIFSANHSQPLHLGNQSMPQMNNDHLNSFSQLPFGVNILGNNTMQDQLKEANHRQRLQQLENERAYFRRRKQELLQAKLIGNPQVRLPGMDSYTQSAAPQMNQNYDPFLNSGQNVLNPKSQSRQESIDSGLDLMCNYSSSTESTNRVSPELYLLGTNNQTGHIGEPMQQQQQQAAFNSHFGSALNHKLISSGAAATQTTGDLSEISNDIISQTTNFGRVKLMSGGDLKCPETMSSSVGSTPTNIFNNNSSQNNNYLPFPANADFPGLDEYDSMSITSSPCPLDVNANSQPMMDATMTLNPLQFQNDDNFINNLLNGEQFDLQDSHHW